MTPIPFKIYIWVLINVLKECMYSTVKASLLLSKDLSTKVIGASARYNLQVLSQLAIILYSVKLWRIKCHLPIF